MMSLVRRTAVAVALVAACNDRDPLDSATNNTAVSVGPTGAPPGDPSGGSSDMTEGTATDPTDGTSTDLPTTGTTAPGTTESGTTEPGTTEPDTTGSALSHAVDIQPIWDANCVTACHKPGGVAEAWFILSEGAYEAIVGKQSLSNPALTLVAPGDIEASYLWHKINGTQFDVGGEGAVMPPPPAAKLSADELDTIGQWIADGCPP